jgi:hypothetical protein
MRLVLVALPALLVLPAPVRGDGGQAVTPAKTEKKDKPAKPPKVYTDEDLKNAGKEGKDGKGGAVTFLSEPQAQADSGSAHGSSEGGHGGSSETRTAPDTDSGGQAASEGGTLSEGGSASELGWRARAREVRESIKNSEKEIARLEAELEDLNLDRQPNPADVLDPMRLQNREARKAEARTQLEAARAQLVVARQALEDLEAEARKAGVPYGWLEER